MCYQCLKVAMYKNLCKPALPKVKIQNLVDFQKIHWKQPKFIHSKAVLDAKRNFTSRCPIILRSIGQPILTFGKLLGQSSASLLPVNLLWPLIDLAQHPIFVGEVGSRQLVSSAEIWRKYVSRQILRENKRISEILKPFTLEPSAAYLKRCQLNL